MRHSLKAILGLFLVISSGLMAAGTARAAGETPSVAGVASPAAVSETARWRARLMAALESRKRYPARLVETAKDSATELPSGQVKLSFEIDRSGRIVAAQVGESSGLPEFDAAGLAMVKVGSRLPRPPSSFGKGNLHFSLPVRFVGTSSYP